MTKQELEDLVNQIYASYNQSLYETDRKVVLRAWYDVLHDIPYGGGKRALLDWIAISQFMPKPGDIRRKYRDTIITQPPIPQIAWATLVGVIKDANSGTPIKVGVHPAITQTISLLGDAVWGYHTNSDRTDFYKAYEFVVNEMQQQNYAIPENGTQAQVFPPSDGTSGTSGTSPRTSRAGGGK